jgi:hypothetical protein
VILIPQQEGEKQAQHLKQDKRQKGQDNKGASSIAVNITNQAFGDEARAASGVDYQRLETEALRLRYSNPVTREKQSLSVSQQPQRQSYSYLKQPSSLKEPCSATVT